MSTTQEPDFAGKPPWRKPGFVLAAAFIALVAVVGIVIAVFSSPVTKNDPDADGRTPPSTGQTNEPAPTGQPTTPPTAAPPGVEWRLLGQSPLPYSQTDGPRTVTTTTAAGFTRTPTGALIAAVQLSDRSGISAGKDVYEPTINQQFVPGPDRDKMLGLLRTAPQTPSAPGTLSTLIGFQYQAYSADTAVIGLVYRSPGAQDRYHVLTVTVQWRDGDWRMVAPPGGLWSSINRPTTVLQGVVEWGPR